MTYFFAPVARTFAIASLTGAALLAGSVAPTWAQTTDSKDSKTPPAAAAATSTKPETVEQRIVALKTALKITPDQESKWEAVATAMRENAASMDKLVKEKQGKMASLNAIDDLKTYQEFTETRLEGLKHLTSAFKSLYDSMTPEQKKNADTVFEKYTPQNPARQG